MINTNMVVCIMYILVVNAAQPRNHEEGWEMGGCAFDPCKY